MTAARLVVLAVAFLLAVQASETRPSFVEWIKQGTGKLQSAYEEVETETTCLQTLVLKNCRCHTEKDGICVHRYDEVKVGCCESAGGKEYSSELGDLFTHKHHVGSCSITSTLMAPISYKDSDAKKLGTFYGTCELIEKAGQCGSPLCEGMVMVITGDILSYDKVAFIHALNPPTVEEDCKPAIFQPLSTSPAKLQYSKGSNDSGDDTKFLIGKGTIYAGTFQVVSRYHKTSYKTGSYQVVSATGTDYEPASKPPSKCYVAKDGAASLDFFKTADY